MGEPQFNGVLYDSMAISALPMFDPKNLQSANFVDNLPVVGPEIMFLLCFAPCEQISQV